jgi:hypothetical protein
MTAESRNSAAKNRRQERQRITTSLEISEIGKRRQPHTGALLAGDDRAECGAEAGKRASVVQRTAQHDADQHWRYFRHKFARVPHCREGDGGNRHTQRFDLRQMCRHLGERYVVIETANVAELHEKQQQRGCILKSGHHRLRRELDQRTEPDKAEQRFQNTAEQDDGKRNRQDQRCAAGGNLRCFGMDQSVDQEAEKERAVDARRIDRGGFVAEQDADDASHEHSRQSGQRAIGEIALAE